MTAGAASTMVRTIMARGIVVAALMLATTTLMMTVVVSTAKAAGALAVGRCGAFGQAFDYSDVTQARREALERCRGADCRVVTDLARACAALAVDLADPCRANGWGRSARLGRAQNGALQACYKDGGRECVIRTFICDAKG